MIQTAIRILIVTAILAVAAPASAQYYQPAPPTYYVQNLGHDNFVVRPQRWAGPNGPVYDPRENPFNPFSYQRQYQNQHQRSCNPYEEDPGAYDNCP